MISRVRYPRRAHLLKVFDLRCKVTSEAASANRRDLKFSCLRIAREEMAASKARFYAPCPPPPTQSPSERPPPPRRWRRRTRAGGASPSPPGRVQRWGAPPPPRRCTQSSTSASLAWARALKAFLSSDVQVIRAAVARSRWDPRRAAALRCNCHTLAVGGKGGVGVSVFARYRLWHLSGPAGGGCGTSAPSSAAVPGFVLYFAVTVGDGFTGRHRGELIGWAGVSRRPDRFRERGAMRRSGDGGPTAAAVSPGNPPPA